MGIAGSRLDLFVCGLEPAEADVLPDGPLEEPGVLEHHREVLAQVVPADIAHIMPIDPKRPCVHIVEAQEQLHEGRLAGPGRPDDRDGPAFRHLCREAMDDGLSRQIAEGDVVEADRAFCLAQTLHLAGRCVRLCRLFLFGSIEELENALCTGSHLLQDIGD